MAPAALVAPSQPSRKTDARIPELDGLRGFAILIVVVWHYFVMASAKSPSMPWYLTPLRLTWSGVDLFFVLSGFLLSGILLDNQRSGTYYRTFYARRALRILPAYLLLIGAAALRRGQFAWPVWVYGLFLQNFFLSAAGWETLNNAMGVSWSLAVEEQFYLCLPACLRRLRPENLWKFGAALVGIAIAFRLVLVNAGPAPHSLMLCRADGFGIGIICRAVTRDVRMRFAFLRWRRWLFLLLSLGMVVMTWGLTWHPHDRAILTVAGYTWIAAFYGVVLLSAVVGGGTAGRIFRAEALRELGQISYFVYLFHELVMALWQNYLWPSMANSVIVMGFASMALVVVLGKLSWKYLEGPLNARGRHFSY